MFLSFIRSWLDDIRYALHKGGSDAKDIQAWLGHSDISTTLNVYGHVPGRDMDRLGQVMDRVLFRDARVS